GGTRLGGVSLRTLWNVRLPDLHLPGSGRLPQLRRRRPGTDLVTKRLVLFDIDGTLLLSGGAGRRAILAALAEEAAIGAEAVEHVRFDGKTDPQIVVELLEAGGDRLSRDQDRIGRVIDRYLAHLERDLAETAHQATVMPG